MNASKFLRNLHRSLPNREERNEIFSFHDTLDIIMVHIASHE